MGRPFLCRFGIHKYRVHLGAGAGALLRMHPMRKVHKVEVKPVSLG